MVPRLLRVALAVPLLAIGLGAASAAARTGPATPLCAQAADPNHVGIVVEHGNGTSVRVCVGFTTPTITALGVLQNSHIEYATQAYGSLGQAVCQIDSEPAQYTECLPGSGSYWVLFVARGGGAWTNSASGISTTTLSSGDDVGFRYDPLAGADPPPVSPAGTCPPATTPTPAPTATPAPRATPTPGATAPPVATSHPGVPTPTGSGVTPASTDGATPASSSSPTPAGSVLGVSSPGTTPAPALGVSSRGRVDAPVNAALVIAVLAIAALVGLLGVQGLRRRRQ
jgi:hypothetical protein